MPLVGEATLLNSGLQIWPEKWRVEGATAERDGVCTTQRVPPRMDTQLLEKRPLLPPYSVKFVSVNQKQEQISKCSPQNSKSAYPDPKVKVKGEAFSTP